MRAARRVGVDGIVYAEDINPPYIGAIERRAIKEQLSNVKPTLGSPDNPKLLPGVGRRSVAAEGLPRDCGYKDVPAGTFGLPCDPSARIGIIDRNGSGSDHGLNRSVVESEMTAAGFREVEHYDFTKADGQDYFLVFVQR